MHGVTGGVGPVYMCQMRLGQAIRWPHACGQGSDVTTCARSMHPENGPNLLHEATYDYLLGDNAYFSFPPPPSFLTLARKWRN